MNANVKYYEVEIEKLSQEREMNMASLNPKLLSKTMRNEASL